MAAQPAVLQAVVQQRLRQLAGHVVAAFGPVQAAVGHARGGRRLVHAVHRKACGAQTGLALGSEQVRGVCVTNAGNALVRDETWAHLVVAPFLQSVDCCAQEFPRCWSNSCTAEKAFPLASATADIAVAEFSAYQLDVKWDRSGSIASGRPATEVTPK